ncbi:hypothetical protein SAMN05192588_2146 [Nonlabens sp. Hel1_33_55]|uniref:hypothetical protein n=1 Tax=Nonlabens sp. Hel1_33_55 TaxID=1336802 RepID=UPI000875D345|nr:hypothetical protein [Nonlabens sp. Hel1_33_55]SCY30301.1 hypothetical protein SAMN05192588_2146 [Nonlabens sp. Hel1_33_55]
MKNIEIKNILIFTMLVLFCQSQICTAQLSTPMNGGWASNMHWSKEPLLIHIIDPQDIKGNPYLYKDFQKAIVVEGSSMKEKEYSLNYNLLTDLMILEYNDVNDIKYLERSARYDILIDGRRFRWIEFEHEKDKIESYAEILESYQNDSFLVRLHKIKVLKPGAYNANRFSTFNQYYLIYKNGSSIELKNNKKEITGVMSEEFSDEVKDYIDTKNIKFENDLRGLKGVARYYTGLTDVNYLNE